MPIATASPNEHAPGGMQILVELRGCKPEVLEDTHLLVSICGEVAKRLETSVLKTSVTTKRGCTVVSMIIAESHIILRALPKLGIVSLDIFTCGKQPPDIVLPYIRSALAACCYTCEYFMRGKKEG